jgi:predicted nuclease with TOPRIM domain
MIRSMDWPNADKIADRLQTMLPPAVQEIEAASSDPEGFRAKFIQLTQKSEQLEQMLKNAQMQMQALAEQADGKTKELEISGYKAETDRLKALETFLKPQDVQAIVLATLQQLLTTPDISAPAPQPIPAPGEELMGAPGPEMMGGAEPDLLGG